MGTAVILISAHQYGIKSEVVTGQGYQYFLFSFLFGVSNHISIGDGLSWTKQKTQNHTGQLVNQIKFSG
jgi:hypothetical protein